MESRSYNIVLTSAVLLVSLSVPSPSYATGVPMNDGGQANTGRGVTEIAIAPRGKPPALPKGHTLMFKVHRGRKGEKTATGGHVNKGGGVKDIVIVPRGKHPALPKVHTLIFKVHRAKRGERIVTGRQANKRAGKGDAVPDRRMTIKPVWQPKERSAGDRKRRTVGRGPCHPTAAQRAGVLMEKLERLRQAFLLEDDRRKKAAIARQMRATVKALAAVKRKIEENIKVEKEKCARENRQAVKRIDEWIDLPPPNFGRDGVKKKRTTKTARAAAVPKSERAAGCHFSKSRPAGQGRPGLAGFPESFPRPPGLKSGWTLPTSDGMLYLLGVSGGVRSMVRFVKKALPARGWRITGTRTARNPGAKSDSVYIFFRNKDYCGWIAIGRGAPAPTYMNVLVKKHRGRVGGG